MKSEIVLVKSKSELESVLQIRRLVFINEQSVPESIEVDQKEATYFLLNYNDLPVSTARLRIVDEGIKFERIATLPSYRGKGLGKQLMSYLQSYSHKHYPEHQMFMNAQDSAISFYTQLGWIEASDYFYTADIAHKKLIFPINSLK